VTETFQINGGAPQGLTKPRYLIGRGDGADILLPADDPAASRRHALLERDATGGWSILDLGSRNGVLLNGRQIADRHSLTSTDIVTIGKTQIRFFLPAPAASTITTAAPTTSMPASPTVIAAPPPAEAVTEPHAWTVETPAVPPTVISTSLPPQAAPATVEAEPPRSPGPTIPRGPATAVSPPYVAPQSPYAQSPPPQALPPSEAPTWPAQSTPSAYSTPPHADTRSEADTQLGAIRPRGRAANNALIIMGLSIAAISFIAYFAYVEPRLAQYQTGMGQLAMGMDSFFGHGSLEGAYETLYYEKVGCMVGAVIGGILTVAGTLFRR